MEITRNQVNLNDIIAIIKPRQGSHNEFLLPIPARLAKEMQLSPNDLIYVIRDDGYLLIKKDSEQSKDLTIT